MKLLVMRHGQALSVIEAGVKHDQDRPLSPAGREEAKRQAGRLLARSSVPALILASPLLRARQTGAELRRALNDKPELRVYEPLANHTTGDELYRAFVKDGPWPGLALLIGHMPQLGELASGLLGTRVDLQTAELVAVDAVGLGRSRLLWSAAPADPVGGG